MRGRGFAFLESRGIKVGRRSRARTRRLLNQPFFTLMSEGRPFVTLKAAMSVDGCIAEAPGRRTALTSDAANRHAHRVRAEVDAIGVGVGTILVDDPLLTARGAYRERPLIRVIFDRRLRTPPVPRVLSTVEAGPVIIVTAAEAAARADLRQPLEDRGAAIVATDGTVRGGLRALGERSITSLLLEGGARLHEPPGTNASSTTSGCMSRRRSLGPGGLQFLNGRRFSTSELVERRVEPLGPDVMMEGYVHGPR